MTKRSDYSSQTQSGANQPRMSRRQDFSKAVSSRSLVSLQSVQSILSMDSDCSDDEDVAPLTVAFHESILEEYEESQEERELNIGLVQASWNALLAKSDKASLGERIVVNMIANNPSVRKTLSVDETKRTPRFTEISIKLVEMLDRVIQIMGQDSIDEDLMMMGEEWLEEGLDTRLVHKATTNCLKESLDAEDYSYETEEAWSSTFRDVLKTMTFM